MTEPSTRGPLKRLYGTLPRSLRDRVRWLKRPLWSAFAGALWRATGGLTVQGPFAGLRMNRKFFPPMLLGCYEREVHPWLEAVIATHPRHIVNIGGGNGFYAAGIALRCPGATVIVFEMEESARRVIHDFVRDNGVSDRVDVRGTCTAQTLHAALDEREGASAPDAAGTFIMIDVEGAEMELLDPVAVPALRTTTILVETHDLFVPGCNQAMYDRFGDSHRITAVESSPRSAADWPAELLPTWRRLMPGAMLESMSEFRGGPQTWLLLEPILSQGTAT